MTDELTPKRHPVARIGLISMGLAILPALIGASLNGAALQAGTGDSPGAPFLILAAMLFLWPVFTLAGWLCFHLTKDLWAGQKQYRAWKKTLTPEQLAVVHAAELAALMVVQHEVHKRVHSPEAEARRQDVVDRIVHGSPESRATRQKVQDQIMHGG